MCSVQVRFSTSSSPWWSCFCAPLSFSWSTKRRPAPTLKSQMLWWVVSTVTHWHSEEYRQTLRCWQCVFTEPSSHTDASVSVSFKKINKTNSEAPSLEEGTRPDFVTHMEPSSPTPLLSHEQTTDFTAPVRPDTHCNEFIPFGRNREAVQGDGEAEPDASVNDDGDRDDNGDEGQGYRGGSGLEEDEGENTSEGHSGYERRNCLVDLDQNDLDQNDLVDGCNAWRWSRWPKMLGQSVFFPGTHGKNLVAWKGLQGELSLIYLLASFSFRHIVDYFDFDLEMVAMETWSSPWNRFILPCGPCPLCLCYWLFHTVLWVNKYTRESDDSRGIGRLTDHRWWNTVFYFYFTFFFLN